MYARKVEPGTTYLITRRTQARQFLFKPDAEMKALFLYLLAFCAQFCGIVIHLAVLMSTHEHLVITDPHGSLPVFLHKFHRLVAVGTKKLRGLAPYDCVWDKRQTSSVELLTLDAVIEKMAYAIFNPAETGIPYGDWPGVTARIDDLGQAVWTFRRPIGMFKGPMFPETATLRLQWPPELLAKYGAARLRELVLAELARLEAEANAQAAAEAATAASEGRAPTAPASVTPEALANVSHLATAKSPEPPRSLNPTFAVGRGNHEERITASLAVRGWRVRYAAALDHWRRGDRATVFPEGTWLMVRLHAAPVLAAA
jgi:hypothetical protein